MTALDRQETEPTRPLRPPPTGAGSVLICQRMTRVIVASIFFCLAGCASGTQAFMPGTNLHGLRADGHREALYVLQGKQGRFGEVKTWSRGAVVSVLDGAPRTVLHVGFELNNTGALPLVLSAKEIVLEVIHTDGGSFQSIAPRFARELAVAPQSIGQSQAIFVLPDGVDPSDVRSFQVRWAAHAGLQTYRQATPFLALRERSDVYPYGGVVYEYGHPDYWYYRHFGYCYDPFCRTVIVVPYHSIARPPAPRHSPPRRARAHP